VRSPPEAVDSTGAFQKKTLAANGKGSIYFRKQNAGATASAF
jgi:hypothetical protein